MNDLHSANAAAITAAGKLAADRTLHQETGAWLDAHRTLEPLALQWPRWDKLFAQAGKDAERERILAADLAQAEAARTQALAAEQAAAATLAESTMRLQALEASRQQAIAALAGFGALRLRAERQATYSPVLPISAKSGAVLQVPVEVVDGPAWRSRVTPMQGSRPIATIPRASRSAWAAGGVKLNISSARP